MYDFNIVIPGNRKPGKYLQKILGDNHGINLGSLVDSLKMEPVLAKNQEDYFDLLKDCHSCQSSNKEEFWDVWSNVPGIKLIGLYNPETMDYVARCLINPKEGTFAPIYGSGHYLLEARLLFAGYKSGTITERGIIQEILEDLYRKENSPIKGIPKSKVVKEKITLDHPLIKFMGNGKVVYSDRSGIKLEEWKILLKKVGTNFSWYDFWYDFWDENLKYHEGWFPFQESLETYKKDMKKFRSKCKKYGQSMESDSIEYTITKRIPISEEWEFLEKYEEFVESKLYLDSTREFIKFNLSQGKGWFKKNGK